MGVLTVTDPVSGSDLESVELDFTPVGVIVTEDGGAEEFFGLRLMAPSAIDGQACVEYACDRLAWLQDMAEGQEQDFYREVILLLGLHITLPELDRRRKRHFDIRTLDHSKELRELAEQARSKGLPAPERL